MNLRILCADCKCPKCKGGQPLYQQFYKAPDEVEIDGMIYHIRVDTVLGLCVRCRGLYIPELLRAAV